MTTQCLRLRFLNSYDFSQARWFAIFAKISYKWTFHLMKKVSHTLYKQHNFSSINQNTLFLIRNPPRIFWCHLFSTPSPFVHNCFGALTGDQNKRNTIQTQTHAVWKTNKSPPHTHSHTHTHTLTNTHRHLHTHINQKDRQTERHTNINSHKNFFTSN